MDYPSDLANMVGGKFYDGDAVNNIPPTNDRATEMNDVFDEIINVITAAGLTPDEDDLTQLSTAITTLIANGAHAVIIKGAVFEASVSNGEAVLWDNANSRFDEATADGTANNQAVGIADVTNSEVICFGETPVGLMSGMTPGAKQYLSDVAAGGLVEAAPTDVIKMGIAKSATVIFVDIDSSVTSVISSTFISSEQPITSAGPLAIAHGLGVAPKIVSAHFICKTAEQGYSIGDVVDISYVQDNTANRGMMLSWDSSDINIRFGSDAKSIVLTNKTSGAAVGATNSYWNLVVKAFS